MHYKDALQKLKEQMDLKKNEPAYQPETCQQPNCRCAEIAEARAGGPVKQVKCLAKQPDMMALKQPPHGQPGPNDKKKVFYRLTTSSEFDTLCMTLDDCFNMIKEEIKGALADKETCQYIISTVFMTQAEFEALPEDSE